MKGIVYWNPGSTKEQALEGRQVRGRLALKYKISDSVCQLAQLSIITYKQREQEREKENPHLAISSHCNLFLWRWSAGHTKGQAIITMLVIMRTLKTKSPHKPNTIRLLQQLVRHQSALSHASDEFVRGELGFHVSPPLAPLLNLLAFRVVCSTRGSSYFLHWCKESSIVASKERELGEFGSDRRLCSRIRLWELPDQYVLEPTDGSSPSQYLAISRANGDITPLGHVPSAGANQRLHPEEVYGVAGIIRLLAGTYVPVITGRQEVGWYRGSRVFRVTALQFLCCNQRLGDLTSEERRDEAHYMSLLKVAETTPGLYFSYDTDLTLNAQAAVEAGSKLHRLPLHQQAESRFLWNHFLLQEFIESKLEPFILPIIQGFQTALGTVNDTEVKLTVISRRCMRRVGTRMWRRGADTKGNVANFVETEQIIEAENFVSSYVQVRGSIPILWEQIVDLSYKPTITDLNLEETPKAVERHFQDLHKRYGDVLAVDLINQQGSEGVLSVAFAKAMEKITSDSIRYVPFDFHHICGQLNFARLSNLYDGIAEHLSRQSYFMTDSEEILQEQKGIVRTNCIDCLDRTNVTQSMLGRKALEMQLIKMGLFGQSETLDGHLDFDTKFKCLWADNGDDISIQYSGTPALKGDFVRYGRRTASGLVQDGLSALGRYYYNNFKDGLRQDAMDLVAGHYEVKRGAPSPFQLNGFESFAYLPVASAFLVTGVTLTTLSIREVSDEAYQYVSGVLWAGIAAGVTALVRTNGRLFCSRPRLCPIQD